MGGACCAGCLAPKAARRSSSHAEPVTPYQVPPDADECKPQPQQQDPASFWALSAPPVFAAQPSVPAVADPSARRWEGAGHGALPQREWPQDSKAPFVSPPPPGGGQYVAWGPWGPPRLSPFLTSDALFSLPEARSVGLAPPPPHHWYGGPRVPPCLTLPPLPASSLPAFEAGRPLWWEPPPAAAPRGWGPGWRPSGAIRCPCHGRCTWSTCPRLRGLYAGKTPATGASDDASTEVPDSPATASGTGGAEWNGVGVEELVAEDRGSGATPFPSSNALHHFPWHGFGS
eukprot:EG_transcript_18121